MARLDGLLRVLALAMSIATGSACAREAPPLAADPALEAQVMHIAEELRCLVCQNETIAASHSALAVDLRTQIAQQLRQGRSQQEIRDYMTDRYGEFVLYRPLFNATNAVLWLGPFALLLGAAFVLWKTLRRRKEDDAPAELEAADLRRARSLLEGKSR